MSFKKLISFKSLIPIVLIALVFLIVWQLNLQMQKKTPRSIGNDAPLSKKTNFSEQDYKHYVQAFKKIQSNHYVTKKSTQIGLKITANSGFLYTCIHPDPHKSPLPFVS